MIWRGAALVAAPLLFSFTIYIFDEENVIHEARPLCK